MSYPVLLIRSAGNEEDASALSQFDIPTLIDPYLTISTSKNSEDAQALLNHLKNAPAPIWIVATSVNAIERWADLISSEELLKAITDRSELQFAAIGDKTAAVLNKYGAKNVLIPKVANAESLVATLLSHEKATIILPSGNIAMKTLPSQLGATGWQIHRGVVYETEFVKNPPKSVELVERKEISAIVFRSPSSVRAFFTFITDTELPLICAGETTAKELEFLNKECSIISANPSPKAVAEAVKSVLEGI
jgi:uroporphyrinogen-III synthase